LTYHRAIDAIISSALDSDRIDSIISDCCDALADCKVDRLLTSGGAKTADAGTEIIKKLQKKMSERGIAVAVGSGITADNVR